MLDTDAVHDDNRATIVISICFKRRIFMEQPYQVDDPRPKSEASKHLEEHLPWYRVEGLHDLYKCIPVSSWSCYYR